MCINGTLSTFTAIYSHSTIDIERRINRLYKFCYVPATSTAHNRLLFLLQLAVYSTNEANKAGLKQSIFLDVHA